MAISIPSTRSAVTATPNVTPMIDVMLVLLIIFMLVVPAIQARAALPDAERASARPERTEDRTLVVDAEGRYWIEGREVAAGALPTELARLAAARPEDRVLFVKADRGLDYRVVHEAVDLARRNGFAVVGLVTDRQAASVR